MNPKPIFLLVVGLFGSGLFGQNLVPNHNFEEFGPDTTRCCGAQTYPQNVSYSTNNNCANHWHFAGENYFGVVRSCFYPPLQPGYGIFPTPVESTAMAHFSATFGSGSTGYYGRYPKVQLQQPLLANEAYCVEFSLMQSPFSFVSTRNPGAWFSDSLLTTLELFELPYHTTPTIPQVYFPGLRITSRTSWYHLKHSFVANGGEAYMYIGSFFHNTDTFNMFLNDPPAPGVSPGTPTGLGAFWLLDAVYCYKCSDTLFTVNIGSDTLLCPGESVALHAHYEGFKLQATSVVYNWQTPVGPRADSTVVATTPGYYEVEVVINHRFRARHGVWVHFGPEPPTQDRYLPEAIELCEGHTELLEMPLWDTTTYTWNTGATGNALLVEYPGTYTVVAENFCWDYEETVTVTEKLCDQRLWIPNAFSPDGDGINDYFEIRGNWQTPIALWIFDRWGNVVFHSEDYQNDWDGTYPNGQPAMPGVYTWKITYRNTTPTSGERDRHGTVTIVP
jgi:gliding motility-associated-like protein